MDHSTTFPCGFLVPRTEIKHPLSLVSLFSSFHFVFERPNVSFTFRSSILSSLIRCSFPRDEHNTRIKRNLTLGSGYLEGGHESSFNNIFITFSVIEETQR